MQNRNKTNGAPPGQRGWAPPARLGVASGGGVPAPEKYCDLLGTIYSWVGWRHRPHPGGNPRVSPPLPREGKSPGLGGAVAGAGGTGATPSCVPTAGGQAAPTSQQGWQKLRGPSCLAVALGVRGGRLGSPLHSKGLQCPGGAQRQLPPGRCSRRAPRGGAADGGPACPLCSPVWLTFGVGVSACPPTASQGASSVSGGHIEGRVCLGGRPEGLRPPRSVHHVTTRLTLDTDTNAGSPPPETHPVPPLSVPRGGGGHQEAWAGEGAGGAPNRCGLRAV